jgi:hypothetical protein
MKRLYSVLGLTGCLLVSVSQLSGGQAASQYPMADKIADKRHPELPYFKLRAIGREEKAAA